MIHLLVLAAALLHLQDPAGDAVGDGTLVPPTAPLYANTADFDLQGVTVSDAKDLTVRVTMGALSNPGGLRNGFSAPVIEVYIDTGSGGASELLPGSGMTMPPKHGWNIALRVTGDEAYAVEAEPEGSPGTWPRLPVTVEVQGTALILRTALPRPDRAEVYAVVGVYDPFRQDAWRPLTATASPWSFSSPTQHVPVVDLLAATQGAQRRELDSGVLLPYRATTRGVGWLILIVLGLMTAAAGVVLRRRARASGRPPAAADDGAPAYERFLDDVEEARLWPDADPSVERAAAEHSRELATDADGESDVDADAPAVEASDAAGADASASTREADSDGEGASGTASATPSEGTDAAVAETEAADPSVTAIADDPPPRTDEDAGDATTEEPPPRS